MEKQQLIAIAGPKGGVGKSTISSNLAVALAGMGKKVIAVDFDFGGPNLNVFFGIRDVQYTLDDFLTKKVNNLEDVLTETGIPGLKLIHGGDAPNTSDLEFHNKAALIVQLFQLDCDIIILDLGAGSSYNVVDFLYIVHTVLLITSPEVTSLLKVYNFFKSAIFRWLTFHFKTRRAGGLLELLQKAHDTKVNPHLKTMADFFKEADAVNSETAESAKKILADFSPFVIINRVRTQADAKSGDAVKNLMYNYLSVVCNKILTIPEDDSVRKSISVMKPLYLQSPDAPFSKSIKQIALALLDNKKTLP